MANEWLNMKSIIIMCNGLCFWFKGDSRKDRIWKKKKTWDRGNGFWKFHRGKVDSIGKGWLLLQ